MVITGAPRRRRTWTVVALALVVATSAGCGGSSEEATEDEPPAATERPSTTTTTEEEVDDEVGDESELLEEKLVDVPGYTYRHLTPGNEGDVVREIEASDELLAAFEGFSAHTVVQDEHLIADVFLLDAEDEVASADDAEAQALAAFESWTLPDSTVTTETIGEHQVLHEVGDDGENEWSWWYLYDDGVGYVVNGRTFDPTFAAAGDYVQALVATIEGQPVPPPSATSTLPPDVAYPGETPALEQALVTVPGFYYGDPLVEDLVDFLNTGNTDVVVAGPGGGSVRGARSAHLVIEEEGETVGVLFLYEISPPFLDQPEMVDEAVRVAGERYLEQGDGVETQELQGRSVDLYQLSDGGMAAIWREGDLIAELAGWEEAPATEFLEEYLAARDEG